MIEKHLVIDNAAEREKIWEFYSAIFKPINEDTPIVQSFPREYFMEWLSNPRVVKFLAREGEAVCGISAFTDQLDLEPLLSPAYFKKHYPNRRMIYCPVLAVAPGHRGKGIAVGFVRAMLRDGPEDGMLVFLHSKSMTLGLPRLFDIAGAGSMEGREADSEACWIYVWHKGKGVLG